MGRSKRLNNKQAKGKREGRGDDDDLLELPGLGRLLEASVFGGHGVVRSHVFACDGVSVTCSVTCLPLQNLEQEGNQRKLGRKHRISLHANLTVA